MYMYPVVGIGMTCPDPKGDYTTPDGVVIPTGEGTNSDIGHSSLLYNEYPFTVKTMMVKIDIFHYISNLRYTLTYCIS